MVLIVLLITLSKTGVIGNKDKGKSVEIASVTATNNRRNGFGNRKDSTRNSS